MKNIPTYVQEYIYMDTQGVPQLGIFSIADGVSDYMDFVLRQYIINTPAMSMIIQTSQGNYRPLTISQKTIF